MSDKTEQDWQDGVNDGFINGPNRPHSFTRGPKFPNVKNTDDLNKELASLREQLEVLTDKLRLADKNCELLRGHRDELQDELKQTEEENRELLEKCGEEKDRFSIDFLAWVQNESVNYDFQEEKNHSNEEFLDEFKRQINV